MDTTLQSTDADRYFALAQQVYGSLPADMNEEAKVAEVERQVAAQLELDIIAVDTETATQIEQALAETQAAVVADQVV